MQDLRGRALLISREEVTSTAMIRGDDSEQEAVDVMIDFLRQVDLVHQIIKVASNLIELGHLTHRKFNKVTRTTEEMSKLLDQLKEDLETW